MENVDYEKLESNELLDIYIILEDFIKYLDKEISDIEINETEKETK